MNELGKLISYIKDRAFVYRSMDYIIPYQIALWNAADRVILTELNCKEKFDYMQGSPWVYVWKKEN